MLLPLRLLAVTASFLALVTTASPLSGTNGQSEGIFPRAPTLSQTIKQIGSGLFTPTRSEYYGSIMEKAKLGLENAALQAKNQKIINPYLVFSIIGPHPGFVLLRIDGPYRLEKSDQSAFYFLAPALRGEYYQTVTYSNSNLRKFASVSERDIKLEFIVSDAPKIFDELKPNSASKPDEWDREIRASLNRGGKIIPIVPSFAVSSNLTPRSVPENSIIESAPIFPSSLRPRSLSGTYYFPILAAALDGLRKAAKQTKNLPDNYLVFSFGNDLPGFLLLPIDAKFADLEPSSIDMVMRIPVHIFMPEPDDEGYFMTYTEDRNKLEGFAARCPSNIVLEFIVKNGPSVFNSAIPKSSVQTALAWNEHVRRALKDSNVIIEIDGSSGSGSPMIKRRLQDERSLSKSSISLRPRTAEDVLSTAFNNLRKALGQVQDQGLNDPFLIFSHENGLLAISIKEEYYDRSSIDENNLPVYTLTPKKLGVSSYNSKFFGTTLGKFATDNPSAIKPLFMVEDGYSTMLKASQVSYSKAENCEITIIKALRDSSQIKRLEFDTTDASKKNRRSIPIDPDENGKFGSQLPLSSTILHDAIKGLKAASKQIQGKNIANPYLIFSYDKGIVGMLVLEEYADWNPYDEDYFRSIPIHDISAVQISFDRDLHFNNAYFGNLLGDFAKEVSSTIRPEFMVENGVHTLASIFKRSLGRYSSVKACENELLSTFQKYAVIIPLEPSTSNKHRRAISTTPISRDTLQSRTNLDEKRTSDILSIALVSLKKALKQVKDQGITDGSLIFSYQGSNPGYLTMLVLDAYENWDASDLSQMVAVPISTYDAQERDPHVYISSMVAFTTLTRFAAETLDVATIKPEFIVARGFAGFNENLPGGGYQSREAWSAALLENLQSSGIFNPLDVAVFGAPENHRRSIAEASSLKIHSPAQNSLLPRMEFEMNHFSIIMAVALTSLKQAALQAKKEKIVKPLLVLSTGPKGIPGLMVIAVKEGFIDLNESELQDVSILFYEVQNVAGTQGLTYRTKYLPGTTLGNFAAITPSSIQPEFMISKSGTNFDTYLPAGEFASIKEWRDTFFDNSKKAAIPLRDPRTLSE
ncbi:MAG: hypothetical protein M1829_003903 [Trizodia sp. TS-e1964]|nr:MAG: hypothetical protein M1829_003903 [Trizodia sp. TS-e1964]